MAMATIKFTYEAVRYAKVSDYVKQLSLLCELECNIEVSKGWFTETGAVLCKGEYDNVIKFKNNFQNAILNEYTKII